MQYDDDDRRQDRSDRLSGTDLPCRPDRVDIQDDHVCPEDQLKQPCDDDNY